MTTKPVNRSRSTWQASACGRCIGSPRLQATGNPSSKLPLRGGQYSRIVDYTNRCDAFEKACRLVVGRLPARDKPAGATDTTSIALAFLHCQLQTAGLLRQKACESGWRMEWFEGDGLYQSRQAEAGSSRGESVSTETRKDQSAIESKNDEDDRLMRKAIAETKNGRTAKAAVLRGRHVGIGNQRAVTTRRLESAGEYDGHGKKPSPRRRDG